MHVTFELYDSRSKTDSRGCETQIDQKVPLDENNFSGERASLLKCLRPINTGGRSSCDSASRPTLLEFIRNTVLYHSLNRQHVHLFLVVSIHIYRKMSGVLEKIIHELESRFTSQG